MASLTFTGLCSGTEKKKSQKTGNDYFVTNFTDLPSMEKLSVFGDLGLPMDLTPREYTLVGVSTKGSLNSQAAYAEPVAPAPAPTK